jgi:pimeloyl-ACP methyl ester carboxylesterase
MKKLSIQGIDYAYRDVGTGPAILFAHGLFVDHSIFNPQIACLCHQYRCILVDLPGHGESGYQSQGWTLDDLAAGMANFITHLNLEQVVFVGLSQGGMIGMRLAARFPQLVSKLILVGTSARAEFPERIPVWRETLQALMQESTAVRETTFHQIQQRILDPVWLMQHPVEAEHERQIMLSHNLQGIQLAAQAAVLSRQDIRCELQNIVALVLILVGENDLATPPSLAQEMQSLIPNAQLVIIPAAGHHLPLESSRKMTDEIMCFLANRETS